MARLLKILSVGILAFTLTACGKSEQEKAEGRVDDANQLMVELRVMGIPSADWSDETLGVYESKINHLSQIAQAMREANKEGYTRTKNIPSESFISSLRSLVASARTEKENRRSRETENIKRETEKIRIITDELQRENKLRSMTIESDRKFKELSELKPSSMSLSELKDAKSKALALLTDLEKERKYLKDNRLNIYGPQYSLEDTSNSMKKLLTEAKLQDITTLIMLEEQIGAKPKLKDAVSP